MSLRDHQIVMLVEDNADDERLMIRALGLNGRGTQLIVARSGEQALRFVHGSAETSLNPSLILLDLKLGTMSGKDVLKKLREDERTRSTPVVILTSSDEASDISECYDLGANSYVRKPLDFEEFVDAVRQMEHYWLTVNLVKN